MFDWQAEGLQVRHPVASDQRRVLAVLEDWWARPEGEAGEAGSMQRVSLLPQLFFQHFTNSSYLVEQAGGRLVGFLIGFMSQSQPEIAYIHFVGVDPGRRRSGIGSGLYQRFFDRATRHGAQSVRGITSPGNTTSLAFHAGLGFGLVPSDTIVDGVPIHRDYDGPGLDRVVFTRTLDGRPRRTLLAGLQPERSADRYVFTRTADTDVPPGLHPFATVREDEGLTLVLRQEEADRVDLAYDYLAARITLGIHSDLAAVGLTAVVSTSLAAAGISCNVIAGFTHDHLFVPHDRADDAIQILERRAGT